MKSTKYKSIAVSVALALAASLAPLGSARPASRMGPQKQGKTGNAGAGAQGNQAPQQGDDDQTIQLGTELVTVPLAITDKHNAYINDIKKDDLILLEDNKPQQIFSFEKRTDLPLTMAMLIDISGSEGNTLVIEKQAASKFFSQVLRPNKDLAAIVTFESEAVLVQDLTQSLSRIQSALMKVKPSVVDASVGSVTGTPPIVNSNAGSTALYDAIYSTSTDLLNKEAGRRVIILITDGYDTSSQLKLKQAIEASWRHEVVVYAIGIGDPGYGGVDKSVLDKLTSQTGGRAFYPRAYDELDAAFSQIDEDLRQMYILSYQPTNARKDGSFRTIQVQVKNRKDLTLRYRRGYFAAKPA